MHVWVILERKTYDQQNSLADKNIELTTTGAMSVQVMEADEAMMTENDWYDEENY